MGDKKNKVTELAATGISRAEIARQAGCSTAYVTQTLGPVRKYKWKGDPPVRRKPDICPGCEDPTCKTSGCIGA